MREHESEHVAAVRACLEGKVGGEYEVENEADAVAYQRGDNGGHVYGLDEDHIDAVLQHRGHAAGHGEADYLAQAAVADHYFFRCPPGGVDKCLGVVMFCCFHGLSVFCGGIRRSLFPVRKGHLGRYIRPLSRGLWRLCS